MVWGAPVIRVVRPSQWYGALRSGDGGDALEKDVDEKDAVAAQGGAVAVAEDGWQQHAVGGAPATCGEQSI